MSTLECTVENAATLIAKALNPKASPTRDVEYEQLLKLYVNDHEFKGLAENIARGFGLRIYEGSEYGMVLGLFNKESPFAFKLTELSRHFQNEDSGAIIIVMIVVVIAFFPTDESLEDEDYGLGEFIRIDQLVDLLGEFLQQAKDRDRGEDMEVDEMLTKSWRVIDQLPIKKPNEQRAVKGSREGLIRHVVKFFEEHGFVEVHGQEVEETRITITQRFRVQASELLSNRLFEYMLTLRDQRDRRGVQVDGAEQ